jgi:hypothetical protein
MTFPRAFEPQCKIHGRINASRREISGATY